MNNNETATVFDIQKCSFIDGPGMRTTVFFKGCNLRCKWCHNPESQRFAREMMFNAAKCVGCGKCRELCPHDLEHCELCGKCTVYCPAHAREVAGKAYTVEELFEEIATDRIFYEMSGGGVTFSGGECMLQAGFLAALLKKCKEAGIHTAVDTAGCVPWESFEAVLPYTDLFLYDLKCADEALHKAGTGVSNAQILDNLARLSAHTDKDIIIRIPVIPGYNTERAELCRMAEILKPLRLTAVELLPYHSMGEHKYRALGREPVLYAVPTEEEMDAYREIFRNVR